MIKAVFSLSSLILSAACLMIPMKVTATSPGKDFVHKIWNRFTSPKAYLDSAWVFQPGSLWDGSVSYKGYWNGILFQIPMTFDSGEQVTANMTTADHTSHYIGLYGGFGPVSIGYSVSLGKNPGEQNRKLSLDWLGSYYGAQLYLTRFSERSVNIAFTGSDVDIDLHSPSTVSILRADAYYAFNKRRFSYPAAYKGKVLQRKSSGSVVAYLKYQHTGIAMEMEEPLPRYSLLQNGRLMVDQISLGAGYSFNFVPYQRDSKAGDLGGLRNITINLTAIPQIAFLNEMTMARGTGERHSIHGSIRPIILGKFAFCYTLGHVCMVARFEYHMNMIKSGNLTIPGNHYTFSLSGNMSSWLGGFDIHYKF